MSTESMVTQADDRSAGFGGQMKARRKALGFTLRDVEKITDGELSNAYLSQLENGKVKRPSAHVVLMLCAAYAVKHEDALEWLGLPTTIPAPRICPTCGQAFPLNFAADQTRTAAQPEREAVLDELLAHVEGGGPHEWGYRDVTDGTFIEDNWPFDAANFLATLTTPAPAVSTDEIVAVFSENLPEQAARLGVHHNGVESPGQWRDRVRKAAILSRIRCLPSP